MKEDSYEEDDSSMFGRGIGDCDGGFAGRASFALQYNRGGLPIKSIGNGRGRDVPGKNKYSTKRNNQMQFETLKLVTPQSHLIG